MLATLALLCLSASLCSAKVVYVKTTGSDGYDGLSWDTAKKTVQAGINASASGDEIWVAAGTYVERIVLKVETGLYGGFAGAETARSQRNWSTNVTTLDGNKGGSVVTSPSGATTTTTIDGFTIRNGSGTSVAFHDAGGGIYCDNSSPLIANNTISGNAVQYLGGGIYCYLSSPTIVNNTISGNTASSTYSGYGGGIMAYKSSSPLIANNVISANYAKMRGGAIECDTSSSAIIINNVLAANRTDCPGGGIVCYSGANCTIANNIMAFNSSGVYQSDSTPVLRHNCVYGNTTSNYSGLSAGTGDISVDPAFVDSASGEYHLQIGSPCIDAGDDTAVQAEWTDMDRQARIQGLHVDIGADEFDGLGRTATPIFSPSAGNYATPQMVTITCATVGAVIHYTTNGFDPTESDPVVSGPMAIDMDTTIKAKAWRTGYLESSVRNAAYTFQTGTPTFNLDSGTFYAPQTVVISSVTPDAIIRYTTNGFDPTDSDPVVSGPIPLNADVTLKAKAWRAGWAASGVKSGVYTFQTAGPSFNPSGGSINSALGIAVTSATPAAVVHYTTNGNDPTESDPVVTGPIWADRDLTLKAKAWRSGWPPSVTSIASYTIAPFSNVKRQADSMSVTIYAAVVTSIVNTSVFYIESDDRSCAIMCVKNGHGLSVGARVDVTGSLGTSATGERYISVISITNRGTGSIEPLIMLNRSIGGGNWFYNASTGAGQRGMQEYQLTGSEPVLVRQDAQGLNNIGMLITTTGEVTYAASGYFYINDGCNISDNYGCMGVKILGTVPAPDPVPPGWTPVGHYVKVTGISTCFKARSPSTDLFRQVRATSVTLMNQCCSRGSVTHPAPRNVAT